MSSNSCLGMIPPLSRSSSSTTRMFPISASRPYSSLSTRMGPSYDSFLLGSGSGSGSGAGADRHVSCKYTIIRWSDEASYILLFRGGGDVRVSDRDINRPLGKILTKFCSHVLKCKISVTFVSEQIQNLPNVRALLILYIKWVSESEYYS